MSSLFRAKKPRASPAVKKSVKRNLEPELILATRRVSAEYLSLIPSSMSEEEFQDILLHEIVPSKWRGDETLLSVLYTMVLRGDIQQGNKLVMSIHEGNYSSNRDRGDVSPPAFFKCSMCSYIGDRFYHASKHFERVHIMHGTPVNRKRKYGFCVAEKKVHELPLFDVEEEMLPIVRRKKRQLSHDSNAHESAQGVPIAQRKKMQHEAGVNESAQGVPIAQRKKMQHGAGVNESAQECKSNNKGRKASDADKEWACSASKKKAKDVLSRAKSAEGESRDQVAGSHRHHHHAKDSETNVEGMAFVGCLFEGARKWNEIGARLFGGSGSQPQRSSNLETPRRGVFFRNVERIGMTALESSSEGDRSYWNYYCVDGCEEESKRFFHPSMFSADDHDVHGESVENDRWTESSSSSNFLFSTGD